MERTTPERLRAYANALEDPRQVDGVETLRRIPTLDQHMLLALDGVASRYLRAYNDFPNEENIMRMLKDRLISVSSSRDQSVILGLFYTNSNPYIGWPHFNVGIFPMYGDEINYNIRPIDESHASNDYIRLRLETIHDKDPFEAQNPNTGPNFLFFRKSPFDAEKPYQTTPSRMHLGYPYPMPEDFPLSSRALDDNVITQALWEFNLGEEPHLFKKSGFKRFIKNHSDDPKYTELYKAFTQVEK